MNILLPQRAAVAVCLLATSALAQVNWTSLTNANAPRAFGGSCWDLGRNRLVAFGGEQGTTLFQQTVEWDGSAWQTINPPTRPSARRRPALAYDAARGETVLFGGGFGTNSFLGDTWTYNGTTWTQRSPATVPPSRFGTALAYDSTRQVVVMFGGFVPGGTDIADTWEWDGNNWSLRASSGPTPRGAHRMAYDQARGVVTLYGGYSTPAQTTLSDTWSWDGATWTQGTGGPGSLCDQVMAYDPTRQRIVLWGGLRLNGAQTPVDLNGLWEWNGASWTQRTTAQTPIARSSTANAFDPVNNRIVLGGGVTGTGFQFNDTWSFRPINQATTSAYGTGCPTSAGAVLLDPLSLPYLGLPFDLQIGNAPPAAVIGIALFGVSNTLWGATPLPFNLGLIGAPGCQLLASVDVPATVLLNNGVGVTTWVLPNQPTAIGLQFYTQGFVFDPASTAAFPIGASQGRQFTIGAP
jgi:hypothetical protein